MASRITFDLFSGRPNPSVIVDGAEEADLLERLTRARRKGGSARGKRLPESTLGYRGIVIERIEERPRMGRKRPARDTGPRVTRIAAGILHSGRSVSAIDPYFEDFICGTTGPIRLTGLGPDFS